MKEQNFTSPVIFCTTVAGASVGVFTNGSDTYVVQVCKMVGRAAYEFKVSGKASSGISRLCPLECWEDLASWLGAIIVKVDSKWINKEFGKEYIRPYKEAIKQAKEVKEESVNE